MIKYSKNLIYNIQSVLSSISKKTLEENFVHIKVFLLNFSFKIELRDEWTEGRSNGHQKCDIMVFFFSKLSQTCLLHGAGEALGANVSRLRVDYKIKINRFTKTVGSIFS